jgi:hypothetical protein
MQHGRDFISKTHHPRMGEYREHSKLWEARRYLAPDPPGSHSA